MSVPQHRPGNDGTLRNTVPVEEDEELQAEIDDAVRNWGYGTDELPA
ncbi:hypothetical protein ACWDA3_26010 [Nonomuraea rubra]